MLEGEYVSEYVSEVLYTEKREVPEELIEAQRIQIDPDYGMKVRHEREIVNMTRNASPEEHFKMAMEMDEETLFHALYTKTSRYRDELERIKGVLNENSNK